MSVVFNTAVAYSVPVVLWIIWKRKTSASVFPLLIGICTYMLISILRGIARGVIYTDSLQTDPLMFYFVSALLSGVFEEVGRFVVFRQNFVESWTDCVSYGIGHSSIEIIITHMTWEKNIIDSLIDSYDFAMGISFSIAMSMLVYIAANYSDSKKFLAIAIGLHTLIDFMFAGYFLGTFTIGEHSLIHLLFIIGVCYFSYRVYRHFIEY